MLTYLSNFNDVYAGRLAGPGEGGPFLKIFRFIDLKDAESWIGCTQIP
jgi:hypothetical protein